MPGKYKVSYRDFYTGQNLYSVRVASAIFLLLNGIIRALYYIFPSSLTKAENFPEFDVANWAFLFSGILYFLISNILIENYKKKQKSTAILSLFVFSFALYLIACGMYSSFITTSDPKNAITLYLVALIIVSILFVSEYFETIILIIASELLFTSLLIRTHSSETEMLYSQIISMVLLSGFYLVSRYFFVYKSNYYLQLIEIRQKNLEIEHGSEFKSQLLGLVAHDLRNPIAAVESLAMMMEMDEIDEDTQDSLNLMKASCVKARTIIDELLEAARNENTIEFKTQKTELNKFLIDVVNMWKIQKDTQNIELISRVSPAYALLNLEKFQRVLDNLIGNALKFSKSNLKVDVIISKVGSTLLIEVKDRGIGIPKEKLPIIFDPFTKAGRAGLNGEQSTGLGLSIVKQIVEKHNGSIKVESEEGKGSTFSISLPAIDI